MSKEADDHNQSPNPEKDEAKKNLFWILENRYDFDEDSISNASAQEKPKDKPKEIDSFDPDVEHKHAVTEDFRALTELKQIYAKRSLWVLVGQLIVMNVVFILVGANVLKFSDYILHLYTGGTLLEVFGMVLVITKSLFPKK